MNTSKVDGMQIEKYNQTDRQQGLVSRFCEGHIYYFGFMGTLHPVLVS